MSAPSSAGRVREGAFVLGGVLVALLLALASGAEAPTGAASGSDPPETLVVTGSREPHPLAGFPGSVEVLTRADLEAYPYESLGDVLRQHVGLHVDQPGGRSGRASVFTRGLDPNHTLVLVDGIALNDPTNARGGSFDFSTLGIGDIERIEIVRGPLSAVHGSDAIAGAIHIQTSGGRGPDRAELAASGGRFGAARTHGSLAGERGPFDLALGGSYEDDGGPEGSGHYRGAAANGSLGVDLGESARLRAVAHFTDTRSESFPEFSGGHDLATLRSLEHREPRDLAAGVTLDLEPAPWLGLALLASTHQHWEDRSSPGVAPSAGDPFGIPAEPDAEDRLRRYDLSGQATLRSGARLSLTLGGEIEWSQGESDATLVFFGPAMPPLVTHFSESRRIGGPFAEARLHAPFGAELLAGLRGDFSSDGDQEWSPRVAASLPLEPIGLELFGSWGEGFKLPSFFALGNPVAGNPDLDPERSRGWDAGGRGSFFGGKLEPSASWFDTTVRDLIDFDLATFRLENLDRVRSRGVELELLARPHPRLSLRAHATWTDTSDRDGRRLRNRPRWKGGLEVGWSPREDLRVRLQSLFVGEVLDGSVPTAPQIVELDAWSRFDLLIEWQPAPWLETWVAVDNLFDADYEEAVGFPSVGVRPRAGLRIRYRAATPPG